MKLKNFTERLRKYYMWTLISGTISLTSFIRGSLVFTKDVQKKNLKNQMESLPEIKSYLKKENSLENEILYLENNPSVLEYKKEFLDHYYGTTKKQKRDFAIIELTMLGFFSGVFAKEAYKDESNKEYRDKFWRN